MCLPKEKEESFRTGGILDVLWKMNMKKIPMSNATTMQAVIRFI